MSGDAPGPAGDDHAGDHAGDDAAADSPPAGPRDFPADLRERLVTVVHDLRTPLTIADGFSALLLERLDDLEPEQVRDFATRIRAATVEMRAILDDERAGRPPAE